MCRSTRQQSDYQYLLRGTMPTTSVSPYLPITCSRGFPNGETDDRVSAKICIAIEDQSRHCDPSYPLFCASCRDIEPLAQILFERAVKNTNSLSTYHRGIHCWMSKNGTTPALLKAGVPCYHGVHVVSLILVGQRCRIHTRRGRRNRFMSCRLTVSVRTTANPVNKLHS